MLPCIASTKPRAMARPSPTPAPVLTARSSRRWEGLEYADLGRGLDPRTTVDHPQLDPVIDAVGGHPDPFVIG